MAKGTVEMRAGLERRSQSRYAGWMAEKVAVSEGTFNGCFGCGTANQFGLRLVFERHGDEVLARTSLGREYAGYKDFVHGGIVATMLDEAMGWALLELGGSYGVTHTLNVRYRRPVFVGRKIIVRASILDQDDRRYRVGARVEDELGRVLATAEGEWAVVREERAAGV